jgi:hypothetical protein
VYNSSLSLKDATVDLQNSVVAVAVASSLVVACLSWF